MYDDLAWAKVLVWIYKVLCYILLHYLGQQLVDDDFFWIKYYFGL